MNWSTSNANIIKRLMSSIGQLDPLPCIHVLDLSPGGWVYSIVTSLYAIIMCCKYIKPHIDSIKVCSVVCVILRG